MYDLCLADIRRPAGSTVITAADITDTRADEAVCGVMRDSVTGIPTAQLQAQALAMMTQLSTELHTKLDALGRRHCQRGERQFLHQGRGGREIRARRTPCRPLRRTSWAA